MIVVGNKVDLLTLAASELAMQKLAAAVGKGVCLRMSVAQNEGSQELLDACVEMLSHRVETQTYRIPQSESRIVAIMHRDGKVLSTEYEGNDVVVRAILPREFAARLEIYKV